MDLAAAREAMNVFYEDTRVVITQDPDGRKDDAWDEETGTYTRPGGDSEQVYDGPGYVADVAEGVTHTEQGMAVNGKRSGSLPWDSPEVPIDALLTVVENPNPALVGQKFRVTGVVKDTLLIEQALVLDPDLKRVRKAWTPTSA